MIKTKNSVRVILASVLFSIPIPSFADGDRRALTDGTFQVAREEVRDLQDQRPVVEDQSESTCEKVCGGILAFVVIGLVHASLATLPQLLGGQ